MRTAATLLLLPPALVGLLCAGFYLNVHRQAAAMSVGQLPVGEAPEAPQRLLVLAPHCDDETLGLGGTIADARARGVPVTIAFFTNGDGFRVAASQALKKPVLRPQDFVRFAESRQKEALRAASALGVGESDVVFLGFPDRGLTPLWQDNWSDAHPLVSPFTQKSRSPYPRSQTPQALYSGESLTRELTRLLKRIDPTDVYVTHPSDDHPDHSAAPAFARVALARASSPAQLHFYLVHRGDWPLPQGSRPDAHLLPPAAMARLETHWESLPLSEDAEQAKQRALGCYGSQLALCERFLTSFVRRNELVATLPSPGPSWRDPAGDNLARFTNPAADITGVSVQREGAALKLRVALRGRASSGVRYLLRLRGQPEKPSVYLELKLTPAGRSAQGSVPLTALGVAEKPGRAWVCAETYWSGQLAVDRTGWREVIY